MFLSSRYHRSLLLSSLELSSTRIQGLFPLLAAPLRTLDLQLPMAHPVANLQALCQILTNELHFPIEANLCSRQAE